MHVSSDSLASVQEVRILSDGRMLVNDWRARRVVLFDSALSHPVVVADTTSGTAKAYGGSGGTLLQFRGDTSLFADYASLSFLVISPEGRIARVLAAPQAPVGGLAYLAAATIDPMGNVVSVWSSAMAARLGGVRPAPTVSPRLVSQDTPTTARDSSAILRVNIATRKVDTVVWLSPQVTHLVPATSASGALTWQALQDPMPLWDAYAVLSDGTIAVVRGHDYHIDWIAPNGSRTSSAKVPHLWERISDSMKVAILDSVKAADSVRAAAALAARPPVGGRIPTTGTQVLRYIDPSDLPDYWPPFPRRPDTSGPGRSAWADADGDIWIRAFFASPVAGGSVYDVVNRQGKLIDRVQLPGGTNLVGFGRGVVYLVSREGGGYRVARARIR